MATTSTVTAVKSQLVASLGNRAGLSSVDVSYGWLPWAAADQLFFGDVDGQQEIPTMKAGRKARQESYSIDLVIRTVDMGGTPYTASVTEARAFALLAEVEDQLADDVQVEALSDIQRASVGTFGCTMTPIEGKGWGCELLATIEVEARLS